jgi:copper(I)-binding protein
MKSTIFIVSAIVLLTASLGLRAGDGGIRVSDAWIAEAPPVSRVQAGYLTIENNSVNEAVITGMSCEGYARAEFHRTVESNGMASMQHQPELRIAAGEALVMQPGGYHVMLYDPAARLTAGDTAACTLKIGGTTVLAFNMLVKKARAMQGHNHHNHEQHDHEHHHD